MNGAMLFDRLQNSQAPLAEHGLAVLVLNPQLRFCDKVFGAPTRGKFRFVRWIVHGKSKPPGLVVILFGVGCIVVNALAVLFLSVVPDDPLSFIGCCKINKLCSQGRTWSCAFRLAQSMVGVY